MNSVGSYNLSLKYQRFTPSGRKDTGSRKFEVVEKTHCLFQQAAEFLKTNSPVGAQKL